jgi:hypothetical protein
MVSLVKYPAWANPGIGTSLGLDPVARMNEPADKTASPTAISWGDRKTAAIDRV